VLAALLDRATGGQASLEMPAGSVWYGRAKAVVVQVPGGKTVHLSSLAWAFLPHRLLQGEVCFSVTSDDPLALGSTEVGIGFSGLHARRAKFIVGSSVLLPLVPLLDFVQPAGTLQLQADELKFVSGHAEGEAVVEWRGAGTKLSQVRPLGDYRINLVSGSDGIRYDVSTVNGPLRVEGHGTFVPNGARKFQGTARADPPYQAQLVDLMRLLGRDQGQGVFALGAN
jgi:general secretion pathway protein N